MSATPNVFTCPACGHQAVLPSGQAASESVLICGECKSRIAYGQVNPRVLILPDATDKRFMVLRFDLVSDGKTTSVEHRIDRGYGVAVAQNVASVCR